jgi:hypothetical protein
MPRTSNWPSFTDSPPDTFNFLSFFGVDFPPAIKLPPDTQLFKHTLPLSAKVD